MSYIASNISTLRASKGISQGKLGEHIDCYRSTIASWEQGVSKPSIEAMICIANFFNITLDALVRIDLRKASIDKLGGVGNNRTLMPIVVDKDGENVIEVVSAKASAGYINGYADPEYIEQLPQMIIPYVGTDKCRAFTIQSDSMPPLQHGDLVVGRYIEHISSIRNGKGCIIVTKNDGILFKRVYHKRKGTHVDPILLVSENILYDDIELPRCELLEVWGFELCVSIDMFRNGVPDLIPIKKKMEELQIEINKLTIPDNRRTDRWKAWDQ